MNLQVIAIPGDDIVWTSGPLPGKAVSQKDANRAHPQLRSPAERVNSSSRPGVPRKLRCCPGPPGNTPKPSASGKPARSLDEKTQCLGDSHPGSEQGPDFARLGFRLNAPYIIRVALVAPTGRTKRSGRRP